MIGYIMRDEDVARVRGHRVLQGAIFKFFVKVREPTPVYAIVLHSFQTKEHIAKYFHYAIRVRLKQNQFVGRM